MRQKIWVKLVCSPASGLAVSLLIFPAFVRADCVNPANAIVQENCLSGNPKSEWDVSGAGDLSIQGFGTDISVNKGQTIHFKIKTSAPSYRIDIYRLGFYAGTGARKVASILPSATLPQTQPPCVNEGV